MANEYKCDIAGCEHQTALAGYDRPQDLGRHKWFAHNVKGKSAAALDRQRATQKRPKTKWFSTGKTGNHKMGRKMGRPLGVKNKPKTTAERSAKWREAKALQEAIDPQREQKTILIAGLFGAITEKLTQAASRTGVAYSSLAAGIAELLAASN